MKSKRRVAAIGDIHGCLDELKTLYDRLCWLSLDEIWGLGDLVDRGPDSGGVVAFMREKHIPSILGNHDDSILGHWKRHSRGGHLPSNLDKQKTVLQLKQADIDYIEAMPKMHIFDDIRLVLVHGGLWPRIPLYAQPLNIIRAQLIHPHFGYECRWWGHDAAMHKCKLPEEVSLKQGWERWYRLYDHDYDCVYGHSVWNQPMIHQNPGFGRTVGIDTGSCFGGSLTAAIFDGREPWFVSVKVRQCHAPEASRVLKED